MDPRILALFTAHQDAKNVADNMRFALRSHEGSHDLDAVDSALSALYNAVDGLRANGFAVDAAARAVQAESAPAIV